MRVDRRRVLIAGAILALLLVSARLAAITYVDHAWFDEQGASAIWWAKLWNSVLLIGSTWAAGSIFVFLNIVAVLRSVRHLIVARQVANIEIESAVPGRLILAAATMASLVLGGLLTLVQDGWTTLARARYLPPFGVREPSLGADVAFWVGRLPLERAWYTWAQTSLVAVATLVVLLYAVTRSLRWTPRGLHTTSHVRRHLSTLGALLLLLLAWNYRLERLLLPVNLGPQGYFGIVEQRMLGVLLVLTLFTAACALIVLWAGYVGHTRVAFASVTAIIVVALLLQQGGPSLVRWASGADLEAPQRIWPFLGTQASFTRLAYGVPRTLGSDSSTLVTDLDRLDRAVAVWDPAAVVAAVERSGRRREVMGGVSWWVDSLGLEAVTAAREGATDSLRRTDSWVVATVRATPPPDEVVPVPRAVPIRTALIYPGARSDLLVSDSAASVRAPFLGRGIRRFAFALAEQDLRLFFEPAQDPNLRLLSRRDVRERVLSLAPIFEAAANVVPLHVADSLYWALPLFVTVRSFPLSHPWVNNGRATKYFQHAATAVVNAHTGRVRLVRSERMEPVATAWARRFPELFVSADSLDREIANALPLPEDALLAQAFAYGATGGDSERRVPLMLPDMANSDSLDGGVAAVPYLPTGARTVARAIPLLDTTNDRLREIVAFTGGTDPRMSVIAVDSAPETWSEQLEQLQQRLGRDGALTTSDAPTVHTRARLLPSPSGAILIRPVYSWRADGVPALARVAVLHRDSVRAASSLSGLGQLEGRPPGSAPLDAAAAALYERMRDALRRADWGAFGQAFEALGRALGVGASDGDDR